MIRVRLHNNSLDGEHGQLFIEVVVAVLLLAITLLLLTKMQAGIISDVRRDEALTKAALAAQYVMSQIEVDDEPPMEENSDGPLSDILRKHGYFEKSTAAEEEQFVGWQYNLEVIKVPFMTDPDLFRRVDLRVSWPEDPNGYSLTYLRSSK